MTILAARGGHNDPLILSLLLVWLSLTTLTSLMLKQRQRRSKNTIVSWTEKTQVKPPAVFFSSQCSFFFLGSHFVLQQMMLFRCCCCCCCHNCCCCHEAGWERERESSQTFPVWLKKAIGETNCVVAPKKWKFRTWKSEVKLKSRKPENTSGLKRNNDGVLQEQEAAGLCRQHHHHDDQPHGDDPLAGMRAPEVIDWHETVTLAT